MTSAMATPQDMHASSAKLEGARSSPIGSGGFANVATISVPLPTDLAGRDQARDRNFVIAAPGTNGRAFHVQIVSTGGVLSINRDRHLVLLIFLLHFGGEAAAVELERDGVADLGLGGVAEDGTRDVGGDGVAAFENF